MYWTLFGSSTIYITLFGNLTVLMFYEVELVLLLHNWESILRVHSMNINLLSSCLMSTDYHFILHEKKLWQLSLARWFLSSGSNMLICNRNCLLIKISLNIWTVKWNVETLFWRTYKPDFYDYYHFFYLLNHLSATLNNGVGVTRCQDPFWMIKTYLDLLLILWQTMWHVVYILQYWFRSSCLLNNTLLILQLYYLNGPIRSRL